MKKVYLDNAATSIPDPRTLACAERFVGLYTNPEKSASDITRQMRGYMTGARKEVAQLIGCDEDEVALVQCTTHALGIAANAVPLQKGDNVLICDLEYQASVTCWKPRIDRIGAELREVKSRNGRVTAADFEAVLDENTRAIVLASVQEINGFRADVKQIAQMAHCHGVYLIVDGAQEVGAMRVNVRDTGVDFYCAGSKKWLGNPFGTGFLYIRRELIPKLDPMYYGYFSMKVPERFPDYISYLEDPSRHPFDDVGVIDDATKFEIMGFGNYLGALGLMEAIRVQRQIGLETIEQHIKKLNRRLVSKLAEIGIRVCSPTDEQSMSSIASFNFGFPQGNTDREKKLVSYLQERGILVSLRSSTGTGGIRISMHYYNTPDQIDALVEGIASYMREYGVTQDCV